MIHQKLQRSLSIYVEIDSIIYFLILDAEITERHSFRDFIPQIGNNQFSSYIDMINVISVQKINLQS